MFLIVVCHCIIQFRHWWREQVLLGHLGEGQLRGTGDRGWLQEPCYQVMPQLWNYRCRTFVGLCIYSIEIPSFLKINHWPECSNVLTFNYNSVCQVALVVSDSMDCSPPGFSVLGILQTSILEWVAMPSSRGFS